jgi:ABC-type multidrug transport system fused ATPase/permease subunit
VAVVGPSGVGKTTLLSLVLGFYRTTSGEIMFDGIPVSKYNLSSLRKRIGYVSQKPQLLSGSILENLRYGNPEADNEKIYQAAEVSGIHSFILSLPKGYHAKISEQGVNLSDGQKQRIALARALVKDPDILILDEPTAALDAELEDSIFSSLPEMMSFKTLFVVTHRLSTIKKAKYILVFNERKLVAKGTHKHLIQNSRDYQKLVATQESEIKS